MTDAPSGTGLEQLGVVERTHTSFSQLDTYNTCGQKFYLQRIARAPQEPAGALIGGRLVHAVIEESERQGWWRDVGNFAVQPYDPNEGEPPRPVAIDLFHERLDLEVERAGGEEAVHWGGREVKGERESLLWWHKNGEFMLRRYQVTREAMHESGWGVAEDRTELRVETTVPGLSLPIVAYLDKFLMHDEGEALIVDWKTGRIGSVQPMQFATYSAVIEATRGLHVTRGVAVFLRAADAKRRVQPVEFEGLLDHVGEVYHDNERGIEAGIFTPRPGWMCSSCSVRRSCWHYMATTKEEA